MDLYSFPSYGDVGGLRIGPTAGIEVMNAILLTRECDVSVAAENSIGSVKPRMAESSRAYF